MKYNHIKYNGVNIHTIKTDQFRKCLCYVIFTDEAKKENMTKNALLGSLLDDSNHKYPTFSEFNKALEDLYGSKLDINLRIKGNLFFYNFSITFLNPKYSETDQLEKNINFLFDTIFEPNIKDKEFNQTIFDSSANYQKNKIKSLYQKQSAYALRQMLNILNDKMPDSFSLEGYLEDFDNITAKNLVEYYYELLKKEMHVFFVGNCDVDKVVEYIKKKIPENKQSKSLDFKEIKQSLSKEIKVVKEVAPNNQAQLVFGLTTHNLTPEENDITMRLYNSILGGGTDSLLFKTIREKQSLCYSIGSGYNSYSNLLSIRTSINNQNYDLAVLEIKQVIEEIRKGNFPNQLLENSKREFINILKSYDDSISSLTSEYINRVLYHQNSIDKRIEIIKKITKEDIINVSNKINLDVIYFLEAGDNNEKI